jgi:ketosteroid isomerase-like protein
VDWKNKDNKMDITALDSKLNEMILTGKALEAFDELYADDLVMQENNEEPRVGKALNRKFEEEFFAGIQSWNEGRLDGSAVNGDISFGQWFMDVTFKNGFHMKSSQIAVRKWKDGKVVHERFFYNKG